MPIKVSENGALVSSPPLQFRSEAVQEIISNKPGYLIRYGNTIFFIILILLFLACWFIQYPDLVTVNAKLTSLNAPKTVVCKTDGKLIKLKVREGDSLKTNAVIGYMESTANHEQVMQLSVLLDTVALLTDNNATETLPHYFNYAWPGLGELQQPYQIFLQAYNTFSNYIQGGFYLQKKTILVSDINNLQLQHETLNEEKEIQQQDLSLAQKTFDMNDTLKKQKVISDLEYRNEKSKLLNKSLSIPQINSSLINNASQQNEKQKEIKELENTIAQQQSIFQQAVNTFKSQVDEWKKKYLLTAPTGGTVSFAGFLQENQQLKTGEIICYINAGNSSYYAEVTIPQANFGKVKAGEQVLLKFSAYPNAEFGSVVGRIDFISRIPTDSGYIAKVSLPNGLTTNYKKQIQYRDGLVANGEIITENMRLLERFYYNMYKQIKRN